MSDETPTTGTVPLDSIVNAPPEIEPSTEDQSRAKYELEDLTRTHERERFKSELGWIGKVFGGRNEKPGNISAVVIVLCFVALGIVWYTDVHVDFYFATHKIDAPIIPAGHILSGLASIITLVLGYLFGSNNRSD